MKFRLAHFEYVQSNDLERIGLSKPAIRRLLAAVKQKQRTNLKKPSIAVRFVLPIEFNKSFLFSPHLHRLPHPV